MVQRPQKLAKTQDRRPPGSARGPQKAAQKKQGGGKLTSVKNQIRGINRLLRKGGLTAKATLEQQRRLEQLSDTLEEHRRCERARKYATKYHKVRFFERVKLERQINKLERQPATTDTAELAARAARLAQLRDDLQYVTHFPKEEKYVSVLKQSDDPKAQQQLEAERQRLRVIVRAQLADAAMVAEPDEGRSLAASTGGPLQTAATQASDDDDDDFFLASDDGKPNAAAVNQMAELEQQPVVSLGTPGPISYEAQPSKGGKQRQRPAGLEGKRPMANDLPPPRQMAGLTRESSSQQPADADFQHHKRRKPKEKQRPWVQKPGRNLPTSRAPGGATVTPGPSGPGQRPAQQPQALLPVQFQHSRPSKMHSKPSKPQPPADDVPLRKRSEGGRKRRKKT